MAQRLTVRVTLSESPQDGDHVDSWSFHDVGTSEFETPTTAPLQSILDQTGRTIMVILGSTKLRQPDEADPSLGAGAAVEAFRG